MSKLSDGLAAVGQRAAIPAVPSAGLSPESSRRGGVGRGSGRWDERVRRATFHIDNDLLDDLDVAAERTGISKSEIVREALRRHLDSLR